MRLTLPGDAGGGDAGGGCASLPFEEVRALCLLDAATRARDPVVAERTCQGIPEGTWRWECSFRVAETHARTGDLDAALRLCGEAESFAWDCVGHVQGLWQPPAGVNACSDPAVVARWAREVGEKFERALRAADGPDDPARFQEAHARAWLAAYLGSGCAGPDVARAAPSEEQPYARVAFAAELVRTARAAGTCGDLAWEACLLATWRGERPGTRAGPSPVRLRPTIPTCVEIAPADARQPFVFIRDDLHRFIVEDDAEDLAVALLTALFLLPDTRAADLAAWIADDRPPVRRTAARLTASLSGDGSLSADRRRELGEHPDPSVRWSFTTGLEDLASAPERMPSPPPLPPGNPAR